jgi:ferrous iron transport protein B
MTPASATVAVPRSAGQRRLVLIGNPNTGKTTLFNALCGIRAKTSNYPGTTTAVRVGRSAADARQGIDVLDLPGVYDLDAGAAESRIAADVLNGGGSLASDVVVLVVDASNLTRNLVLAGQVLAERRAVVLALNMIDAARSRGIEIDDRALCRRLRCPVVPIVARRGQGLGALRQAVEAAAASGSAAPPDVPPPGAALEALTDWAEDVAAEASTVRVGPWSTDAFTERLDRYLTHPVYGIAAFIGVMCLLFWALFTLAAVPMDLIEALFGRLGSGLAAVLPEGPVRDLATQGIVGGLSGTIVFLPQICLLFFLISLLEDTGYLARAAFVMDGTLSRFGLPGQAFVPLLTAHACAIPGIMSARLIPNGRDRLATILVAPFMSCSARLPVYVLLTSLLFADPMLAGLAFAGCYLLGATAGLLTASLFGRTALAGRPRPMILELPSYRVPSLRNAVLTARDQGMAFLRTAGSIIMAICIVMWWLSAYPKTAVPAEAVALRAQAARLADAPERAAALHARADLLQAKAEQAGSFAGRFGQLLQPAFAPLGFDWQLTAGVVTSFLAREVFVSTMSVLEGGGGEAEVDEGVVARIRGMTRSDGSALFTPATAASALVFFVLAMQCLPTLAVTRKETGHVKYAALQLVYMSGLAYVAALALYQGLRLAGVP